jgi:hypothetical protein
VGLLASLGVAGLPVAVAAQETTGEQPEHELEARILAQRHDDGQVEFVLQVRHDGGPWSESATPARRFLPPGTAVDQWFASSTMTLTANPDDPATRASAVVRIVVRRLAGDRIEFALQHGVVGGSWSERLLPERRYFSLDTEVGRRLSSSPILVTLPGDQDGAVPVSGDMLDFDMIDVHSGETMNIRSVVTGETPLLFWLWSPY